VSLLAVDMGSSSCKAVAFSDDGRVLVQATRSYSAQARFPAWSEMPARNFWDALVAVTREISAAVVHDPIEVLSISSHGETFVSVDALGRILGPAILNADNRAVREAARIVEKVGPERLYQITGLTAHAMYPLPKILWLRNHAADTFSHTAQFLTLPGYLLTQMGLPGYVDYSLASRFLAFDIRKRTWSAELLSTCELSVEQFPIPVPAGTIAGELSSPAAAALGLRPGTRVVLGGHDQPCAALGSGVLEPGRVSASLGTYECLVAASVEPASGPESLAANLNTYCHVVPNRYVTLAYFPSGIMIDWLLRILRPAQECEGSSSFADWCGALESTTLPGPSGLFIAPHLLGTCNPDFDPNATGVIAGIRPTTRPADLYKGVIEGISCEFARMAEFLQAAAGVCSDIYISGGGRRSRLGLQLRAAMSNCNLHLMQCPEAVCLGTTMLAGVAVGKYSSYGDAAEQVVRVSQTITPDIATTASYKSYKAHYRMLYTSLASWRDAQCRGTEEEK